MKKALLVAPMASVHRRFNQANIKVLLDLGYEVHLAANFNDGEGSEDANVTYKKKCEEDGIVVHSIPFVRAVGIKNLRLVSSLVRVIQSEKFDVVHAHTETGGLLLRLVLVSLKKDFQAVYTPHGMSFYKGSNMKSQLIYRPIEKWICSRMDKNIAMNMEELEILKKWNDKTRSYVHGVGVDLARFENVESNIREELGIGESTVVITAVGELNENKNHSVVINGLRKLRELDFCFIICGVGELRDKLIDTAREVGIEDKVKLLGYRKDIPNVLAGSDVFVFPSIYEGLPLTVLDHEGLPVSVLEAMASRLPVVCSRIRGNVDLIQNGEGGFLCDPNGTNRFEERIKVLIEDGELRKTMGEKNRLNSKMFSIENVERELIEIYSYEL